MQSLFALAQCRLSDYFLAIDKISEDYTDDDDSAEAESEIESKKSEIKQLFERSVIEGRLVSEPDTRPEILEAATNSLKFYQEQTQTDFNHLYSSMLNAAERVESYFYSLLDLLVRWSEIAESESHKKVLSPQSGTNSSLNLFNNQLLTLLRNAPFLKNKKKIPAWSRKGGEAFRWYKEIVKKDPAQQKYELLVDTSFDQDHAIVSHLIKKIIFKSEPIQSFMEEVDINWEEDREIVKGVLLKTVKSIQPDQAPETFEIPGISYNWEEDSQFFKDLFKTTAEGDKEFEKMISSKAKNWEIDRIATMDKIILKMALSEMINFSSIPIKVTINEYIEISKLYSTPKSRNFVNGILDVLAKELKEQGVIKKSGRGLIDNK